MSGATKKPTTGWRSIPIMRALDPEVADTVWAGIEPLIPTRVDNHPLGRHRHRKADRDCFDVILVRLATGCSWEDAERLCGNKVSDTTVRSRRDERQAVGIFDRISNTAIEGYDRIIGLDFSDVSVDGSLHKSPCGGTDSGPNPTDRGKQGWKWSILVDAKGIPIGWEAAGANRNDSILLAPTLDDLGGRGMLGEIETIWLDRGYDSDLTRDRLAERGITDAVIATKRKKGTPTPAATGVKAKHTMGLRWPVERTNSWLSNFGQLRRNTDRERPHRVAQLALAITFLIVAKLIDWRNRWSPASRPIR
jgi:transposase